MDSFISWIGGKKLLREKVIEQFPEQGTYKRYVEVFGGAGWVLFASDKHAETEVYNDLDGNLVNLFRYVKHHPEALQEELKFALVSREQFCDARVLVRVRGLTDLQRAANFFILIKESFGSDIHSFGKIKKDIQKASEYLTIAAKRLNGVVIENLSYQEAITGYDKPDTLFYLDPPYYKAEDCYKKRFTARDHEELKELLDTIKGKFVLSYNNHEYIRKLYKKYHLIEVSRGNNLLFKAGAPYQELIIKNF